MARNSLKSVCRLIDVANEKLPPEQSFLADLKRSIELEDEKGARKPSQTYKPSSMNCIRNMYYQVTGTEPDPAQSSYCMVGICNSGSDIHCRTQYAVSKMKENGMDCEYINVADYIESRGIDCLEIVKRPDPDNGEYETKLYHKTLNMSFLCDGVILYKGRYYILEIKTEASFKWNNRTDTDPKHHKQATAYSMSLGIDGVIFLYINRDVLDMKSYMFVPTDEMKQNLVGTIEECDGYVSRMICPPKPEDIPKKQCSYCGYKNQCKKDG
jgi:hypothetical protein